MIHHNTTLRLIRRPNGLPVDEDREVRTAPVPAIKDGELLAHNKSPSIRSMRGWLDDKDSFMPPEGLGELCGP